MTTPIRVLLVDDHALFRDGLRAIFMAVTDIEVVGEAASGEEAVQQALELQPEVILMDIQMEGMNGIDACKRILAELPQTRIVMLTMLEDSDSLFAAMVVGAKSYVLKGARRADVLKTIRAVADGEVLFGAAIASRVSRFFQNMGEPSPKQSPRSRVFPELTYRERDILDLIAQGLNNRQIAEQLEISAKTVSNHISSIFNKLQVADRAQAIIQAREAGMGHAGNHTSGQ